MSILCGWRCGVSSRLVLVSNPTFFLIQPLPIWWRWEKPLGNHLHVTSTAVVVSCLPSFRVLLNTRTSRSNSAYNRRNNSGSRSRSRCSSGHGWRLKYLRRSTPADGRATISLGSNGGRSGGCNSSLPTEHFAGAERVDPYDTDAEAGERIREDGSKEYILPKLHVPKDSVHVRRDVVVDFS